MKVLVTGGSGFIGRVLCERLAARGDQIVALLRRPAAAGNLPPAVERVQWDASSAPPARAFDGVDAVVNLAGESVAQRWTDEHKRRMRASRIEGTRNVVSALAGLARRPRVLVSASAIGVYGDRGEETVTEASPPGHDFLAELCVAWEKEAQQAEALGLRVVLPRIGVVLGEGGGALARMLVPFKLGLGGPIGNGRQWMSWVHRDDVVGIVLHAIDQPAPSGALNATAPEPARNLEFTRTLGAVLGRPTLLPVPGFALRLAFGEMAAVLTGGQRVLPERTQASGYTFRFPALAPALRDVLRR